MVREDEVRLSKDEIMEVMKSILDKDKTLGANEVAAEIGAMLGDSFYPPPPVKGGLVPGYDGEADFNMDDVVAAMEEEQEDVEPTLDEDIAEGLALIFGGVDDGPLSTELMWLMDPKHEEMEKDLVLLDRLERKGVEVISLLGIEEIDHLIFFLGLLDKDTGPWYYYRVSGPYGAACEDRLDVLAEIENAELEDDAMMNEAMIRGASDE